MSQKNYFYQRLACRNDYCTHCKKPTFTERYRYLVVLTKFTIPILPIGFDSTWFCQECRRDPREAAPENSIGLLIGSIVGTVLSYGTFLLPFSDEEVGIKWGIRMMFVIFTLVLIVKLLTQDRKRYLQNRDSVTPLSKVVCPYCSGALQSTAPPRCPQCKVDIE